MDDDMKEALTASDTWIRALFMILFAFIYSIAKVVLVAVVILQFFFVLLSRERNERLLELGEDLGVFIFQVLQFQTFNTDEKPFPFGPWPYGADEDAVAGALPLSDAAETEDDGKAEDGDAPADDAQVDDSTEAGKDK